MMTSEKAEILSSLVLAPWIAKAAPLINKPRHIGGNQFRHCMATMTILIDYGIIDAVLLKTAVVHDLIEDIEYVTYKDLENIDKDSDSVITLLKEVTNLPKRKKEDFLKDILENGSDKAKIIKCVDRIANLIDLQQVVIKDTDIIRTLGDTRDFVYPIALKVNPNMSIEIRDLINKKSRQWGLDIYV